MSSCLVCARELMDTEIQNGNTGCEQCHLFYENSLENNKWDTYVCAKKTKTCLTEPSISGTECKYCRFKKCIKTNISNLRSPQEGFPTRLDHHPVYLSPNNMELLRCFCNP
uniref:Nuclear receptor domain-containing protein n=1 Tax=Panagrolaimus superbus TaxID=310955 RepID=A0A914Y2G0_9BILA